MVDCLVTKKRFRADHVEPQSGIVHHYDGAFDCTAIDEVFKVAEKNGVKLIRPEREPFEKAVAGVHKYFSTMVGADLLKEVTDAQR